MKQLNNVGLRLYSAGSGDVAGDRSDMCVSLGGVTMRRHGGS